MPAENISAWAFQRCQDQRDLRTGHVRVLTSPDVRDPLIHHTTVLLEGILCLTILIASFAAPTSSMPPPPLTLNWGLPGPHKCVEPWPFYGCWAIIFPTCWGLGRGLGFRFRVPGAQTYRRLTGCTVARPDKT